MDERRKICDFIYDHRVLFSHKKKWNSPFARTWLGVRAIMLSEVRGRQIAYDLTCMWNLKNKNQKFRDKEKRWVVARHGVGVKWIKRVQKNPQNCLAPQFFPAAITHFAQVSVKFPLCQKQKSCLGPVLDNEEDTC